MIALDRARVIIIESTENSVTFGYARIDHLQTITLN